MKRNNMMKSMRNMIRIAAMALLSLAACTEDDETSGDALPEGKYPMTFTASQAEPVATPQTRVSDYDDEGSYKSKWTAGDKIKVTVSSGGNNMETLCTLDENGNITAYDPQLYWQDTNDATINAWYSNIAGHSTVTDNTVSLADQSKGLAYVLKAEPVTANYASGSIALNFSHQLAKVRVKLEGEKAADVTSVRVNNYTFCTVTDGNVSGENAGYIPMRKNGEYYEANLVPMENITAADFIKLNNKTKASISDITELKAGNMYTINIKVNQSGPEEITGGQTITEPGDYIMKGEFTKTITLKGDGITLTLDGVSSNMDIPMKIEQGTPTIILKGNNSLTASGAPAIWLIGENTNVIIKGTENSHLKVSSTNGSAAIGTSFYSGSWTCGNITIENASIEASSQYAAAAIGTGVGFHKSGTCGVITIIKSDITATAVEYKQRGRPAVIGTGGTDGQPMSCKGINITLKDGQSKDAFQRKLTGPYTKVGAGEGLNNASNTCGYVHWYNADGTEIR